MSQELSLFPDSNVATSDRFKDLLENDDKLIGGSFGTTRRISIKGGKFREIVNGEQMKVSKSDTMNVVIIDFAAVGRTYYEGDYDPDNVAPPVCWSGDTDAPESSATKPQATRCGDCPQNIKGSGSGQSRACRYSQRLAVCVEGDLETVYQLQLPATSIFGDAKESEMPMQGYARFLKAHSTPSIAVVTEMRFDEDAEVPKLFFRATRPLSEDELDAAVALRGTEAVTHAIEFKVFETDKVVEKIASDDTAEQKEVKKKPAAKAKVTKIKADPVDDEDDDVITEPTKVEKKSAPEPDEEKEDLAKMINGWDD